jgi:glucose/arabinose dehydrogenase
MILAVMVLVACGANAQNSGSQWSVDPRPANAPDQKPAFPGQYRAPENKSTVAFDVVDVAEGLVSPWGMAFLPDGRMLVTEKPGRLRIVTADGKLSEPVAGLPQVVAQGQGGLLDVTLDPSFASNRLIYWSYSEPQADGTNNTAVARGRLEDGAMPRVENVQVIYHQSPSMNSRAHFGSRLVWNRDGTLFVTQGDRSATPGRMQSQNMDSLIGKIVRINADGSIPKDNPFVGKAGVRPEIWSFGHRNVQAATLHPTTGELWEVEHGTRGGDEMNIAQKGKDYGWPTIAYGVEYRGGPITGGIQQQAGMEQPKYYWDPNIAQKGKDYGWPTIAYGVEYRGGPITGGIQQQAGMEQPKYYWDPNIAPSGMTFYTGDLFPAWKGNLFIGGLGGTSLVRLVVDAQGKVTGEERLLGDRKERIRNVEQGPDGALYLLIDDEKGRLLKVVPKQ